MIPSPQGPPSKTVHVPLGERSYEITITSGLIQNAAARIHEVIPDLSQAIVIADRAVDEPWANQICEGLRTGSKKTRVSRQTVPSGEPSKSIAEFEQLLSWMLEEGADRRSVVIAVGGGVIGDLAGYVAASFTRGIRFIQIPTNGLRDINMIQKENT